MTVMSILPLKGLWSSSLDDKNVASNIPLDMLDYKQSLVTDSTAKHFLLNLNHFMAMSSKFSPSSDAEL